MGSSSNYTLSHFANRLGLNLLNLSAALVVSFFLALSLSVLQRHIEPWFPIGTLTYEHLIEYQVDFILSLFHHHYIIVFFILFTSNLYFIQYKQKFLYLHRLITRLSLAFPLFTIYQNIWAEKSDSYIAFAISSVLSVVIFLFMPSFFSALLRWSIRDKFIEKSGMIIYSENTEDLRKEKHFLDYLKGLGEIESIKILGVTGWRTFVTKDSLLAPIIQNLSPAALREWKIILCAKDSEGMGKRAKRLNLSMKELNEEFEETFAMIKNHPLSDKIDYNTYDSEPKLKIIILNNRFAMIQGYLGADDIHSEQAYFFESRENASMLKIIIEIFDGLWDPMITSSTVPSGIKAPPPSASATSNASQGKASSRRRTGPNRTKKKRR